MCVDELRLDGADASCDVVGQFVKDFRGIVCQEGTLNSSEAVVEGVPTCLGSTTEPAACNS